jgi:hypothetical protein
MFGICHRKINRHSWDKQEIQLAIGALNKEISGG